ncbi:MAG: hypothetical protein IBX63_04080 [Coriobacteriia bacterium]|nr:hypothetical protein [Coriobacteriia bacterium]
MDARVRTAPWASRYQRLGALHLFAVYIPQDGRLDWSAVTEIIILEVTDYHGE